MQAGSGGRENRRLFWSADEIPLAPGERFVDWHEVSAGHFSNQFGLPEPLFVGAAFELNHDGKSVDAIRNAPGHGVFREGVHKFQKGSKPRFDNHRAAVFTQHAVHLRKSLVEIVWQSREMVQTALDDEDVLAAIGERKPAAISDNAFRRPAVPRDQAGREIHACKARKAEPFESDQTISATAKEFDDFGVARPLRSAQSSQALGKFLNFLVRGLETQVGGFPWIGR